jgi:hypothetical protein
MSMSSASLGQLAELLRRAEARTRVQELNDLALTSAQQLKSAEERIKVVETRARDVRPERQKEIEQIDQDESLLRELIRRTAQNRGLLEPEQFREAELLIQGSREEISRRRHEAQTELDQIARETESARREMRQALERFHAVRRELDRLQVHVEGELPDEEKLTLIAETYFPEYQIRAFAREVEDSAGVFGMLDRREQYAQMKIWIGRLRRFQMSDPLEDEREVLENIFRRLVSLSKQYEPGYIEAFNRQYAADWDAYIAESQEALRLASEDARRNRENESENAQRMVRDREARIVARRNAETAMDRLKAVLLADFDDEEIRAEAFRDVLKVVLEGYGPTDSRLLDLVRPHRDWLTGTEFRVLRKHLEQEQDEAARQREWQDVSEQYRDILALTRGRSALMIGGVVREDARKLLIRTFDLDELEWIPYQDNKPALMDSLAERVRNGHSDIVILLLNFVGHHVSNVLRPICKEEGIPCAMVEHGYGASAVAEALRHAQASLGVIDDDDYED